MIASPACKARIWANSARVARSFSAIRFVIFARVKGGNGPRVACTGRVIVGDNMPLTYRDSAARLFSTSLISPLSLTVQVSNTCIRGCDEAGRTRQEIKGDVGAILKETIVVVAIVNITAGAALLPSGFSTGEKPIVVASCIKWEAVFLFVQFCDIEQFF